MSRDFNRKPGGESFDIDFGPTTKKPALSSSSRPRLGGGSFTPTGPSSGLR